MSSPVLDVRKITSEFQGRMFVAEMRAVTKDAEMKDDIALSASTDEIEFSFSSELPCERWFGTEILSHAPGAANLERLGGMNWLWNHDRDVVLGKVTDIFFKDLRGYCKARWSKKECISGYRLDFEDKILTNVSFMYSIDEIDEARYRETGEIFVTKWTIYEISLVSIPQDHTVGADRSFSHSQEVPVTVEVEEKIKSEVQLERDRVASIYALGERCDDMALARSLVESGEDLSAARGKFLELIQSRSQNPVGVSINPLGKIGLNANDEKQYSLVKVIRSFSDGFAEHKDRLAGRNTFEKEISDQIAGQIGRQTEGFFVPYFDFGNPRQQRDVMNTQTGASGGYTVETQLSSDFIELLRNEAKVLSLGVTVYSGLDGIIDFVKQNLAASFGWFGENGEVPDTEFGFGLVELTPKDFGGILSYTRRLLLQSSISVELRVREELATGMALALDRALLWGTGTNNEPLGIFNRPVHSVSNGTNGGAVTYAKLVELKTKIKQSNADRRGGIQWLTNAAVEGKLQVTPRQSGGVEGNFILDQNSDRLLGRAFNTSEQVLSNLTKGSGTGLSGLVVGDFSSMMLGFWGVLEILPNTQGRSYKSGGVEVRAMQTVDANAMYDESFGVMTDIVTTF